VGRIPLENIFLIGTPLHSQNFIDENEGVLTNNRRIVTKSMWFNGSSLSTRARRALEKEKVTIVSHISGHIHYMYENATINKDSYEHFSEKLKKFLTTELSPVVFISFLRYHMNFKKCFQYRHILNGRPHYIALETLFEYEHSTKHILAEATKEALLHEIEDEEFSLAPLENRIVIQEVEDFLTRNKNASLGEVMSFFISHAKETKCNNEENISLLFESLAKFLNVQPQLPKTNKKFIPTEALKINTDQSREDILELVYSKAAEDEVARLSLYAFRQMDKVDWKPFLKASLERNPVTLQGLKGMSAEKVYQTLSDMPNESIYDGQRLAQPDEAWNFGRGDGIEKALMMANFLTNELKQSGLKLDIERINVTLDAGEKRYTFTSAKNLEKHLDI